MREKESWEPLSLEWRSVFTGKKGARFQMVEVFFGRDKSLSRATFAVMAQIGVADSCLILSELYWKCRAAYLGMARGVPNFWYAVRCFCYAARYFK